MEESAVEGGEGSLIKFQPGLGLLCEAESEAIGSLPSRKVFVYLLIVLSFCVLEIQV